MSTLAERLRMAREAAGFSQEDLAKKVGIVQQSLHKIESGIIRNPRKLSLIESILGLPTGYLLFGDKQAIPSLPQPMIARCPVLDWETATKWPNDKNDILKSAEVNFLGQKKILSGNTYALKVVNDAMTHGNNKQSFNEGSFIIIDPDKKHISGNLVVAIDNKELLFRRYVKDGNREYLHAYNNRDYEPIKIDDSVKICGVVVAHFDELI